MSNFRGLYDSRRVNKLLTLMTVM